jgi:hypothetical protein
LSVFISMILTTCVFNASKLNFYQDRSHKNADINLERTSQYKHT